MMVNGDVAGGDDGGDSFDTGRAKFFCIK